MGSGRRRQTVNLLVYSSRWFESNFPHITHLIKSQSHPHKLFLNTSTKRKKIKTSKFFRKLNQLFFYSPPLFVFHIFRRTTMRNQPISRLVKVLNKAFPFLSLSNLNLTAYRFREFLVH